MIKVTYETVSNRITNLQIKGHAQSAEPGKDLVCSAVSAVTFGGLNALHNNPETLVVKVQEGLVAINENGVVSPEDEIVLKTIITQLETIARDYPKYVKITRKEK
ncbi:MAG: ribosomal-processing cysteine protease Prp [Bacteroidia bacterium]|nr:ribosomal-processing cysteine protease Prp [Bacteroidia bacterium]